MRKLLFVFIIFFCVPFTLLAQNRTVTGNVVDDKGNPAVDVSVTTKSSKKGGTKTDKNGNFSIDVTGAAPVVLNFSSKEFESKTVTVKGTETVNVKLKRAVTTQDEVVVIGYQSVKVKDLTGAVSSLSAKQIKDVPVNSTTEALTGRLAGVQITTDEGVPGSEFSIKVRGGGSITQDNSPLYIIDGIEVPTGLADIAPQDIESVSVLKDASATAIYGARGANGVIIVTTKGGRNTKGKTVVTYNGFTGFRELPKELSVMDPENFVAYQYETLDFNTSTSGGYQTEYDPLNRGWEQVLSYKDSTPVDWQHQVFGRKALMQTHNVSISGGDDATQYNLSLTDNEEQGLQITSELSRKLVNFRFDHIANDKLRFAFNARYNDQVIDGPGTSDQGSQNANSLRQTIKYHPLITAQQAQDPGGLTDVGDGGLFLVNPVLLIQNQYLDRPTTVVNLSGNINYTFNKYLSFKTTLGYDVNTAIQNTYNDSLTYASQNAATQFAHLPVATIENTFVKTINNSNVFTFSNAKATNRFKDHNDVFVLLGEETYQTDTKDFQIQYAGIPHGTSASKGLNNLQLLGTLVPGYPKQTEVPVNQLSYFSKIGYTYNKKYIATFTLRADASSIFSPENRWGYFPAGSAAWRISDESFMQKATFISDMKLRVSYGAAGNNRITPFSYLSQYGASAPNAAGSTASVGYGFPTSTSSANINAFAPGTAPIQLGNSNLKWETTVAKNIGLDVGFFKNRINLTADVYRNDTKDLLLDVSIPPSSGYINQFQNVGATRNTGLELQLSASIIQKKDFNWSATFNISFNKNEVVKLSTGFDSAINSGWDATSYADYLVQVGKSLGQIYGLVNDGWYTTNDFIATPNTAYVQGSTNATTKLPFVYTLKPGIATNSLSSGAPMPGSPKYKDLNGDSTISTADEKVIGNATPKFFGGLNQQFSYKSFDLSVFINFQYGNQVLNANKVEFTNGYNADGNMLAVTDNRWKTIDANGNQIETGTENSNSATIYGIDPAALTAANKNASFWIPSTSHTYFVPQSYAVEDASFIRINNITLGYTLPKALLKKVKIASLRIYGTVNNLAVITGYSGYDPEVSTRHALPTPGPLTPGVDYSAYPRSRSFLLGINLSL